MATIKIPRKELREYGLPYCGYDGVTIIDDTITDTSRWSIHHSIVFRWIDGKTYQTEYSEGATECQDESPWEYEDEVECDEVAEVPVTTTEWQTVLERGHAIYEVGAEECGWSCVNDADLAALISELRDGDAESPDSDFVTIIGPAVRTDSGWHAPEIEKLTKEAAE